MATFDLWPFASTTVDPDQAATEGRDYLHYAMKHGFCISAILADAYQCPPTTSSVTARAAFTGELVRLAGVGGASS